MRLEFLTRNMRDAKACGTLVYICFPPAVVEGLEGENVVM
jgi:hypothetical protein